MESYATKARNRTQIRCKGARVKDTAGTVPLDVVCYSSTWLFAIPGDARARGRRIASVRLTLLLVGNVRYSLASSVRGAERRQDKFHDDEKCAGT